MTIASILRLAYMIHRFYFDGEFENDLITEYQVNTISFVSPPPPLSVNSFFSPYFPSSSLLTNELTNPLSLSSSGKKYSTVEIDVAIICACLPTLKAFLKRFAPRLLGSSSPESNRKPSAYSSFHYNKNSGAGTGAGSRVDRKWKDESHEECLTMNAGGHDGGLEDETDGKSRESYAMGEIGVTTTA